MVHLATSLVIGALTYQDDDSVTAAGIVLDGPFVNQKWKDVSKVFDVNVSGTLLSVPYDTRIDLVIRCWEPSFPRRWRRVNC